MRYGKQFKENIKNIGEIADAGVKIVRNKIKQNKNDGMLTDRYSKPLSHYSSIMGRVNYDKAMGQVKRYVKSGNYQGAKDYVNSQISKINNQ